MTTDTQLVPTDAELESLAARMLSVHSRYWDETNAFAREVLAKGGQPAHSGEPVAWKHDCAALLTNDVELRIDTCSHCGRPCNAPQPVEQPCA